MRCQCGLLDVAVDPAYAQNRRAYLTFTEPGPGGNSTALARARLGDDRLSEVMTVLAQQPKVERRPHCGSRIVFDRQGRLWVGLGDRFSRKGDAQTLDNHLGKVVRIDADGRAPADNPFVGPGKNCGWPLATYGRSDGTDTRNGEQGPKPGIEMPLRHWVPASVAPSGLAFVTGEEHGQGAAHRGARPAHP